MLQIHGDSTIIQIVANGNNLSEKTHSICGVYAFVQTPWTTVLEGSGGYNAGPRIHCRNEDLLPGASLSDSLSLSYLTSDYENRPGLVQLWCWFFYGTDGAFWEGTDFVELGILDIVLSRPSN